MGPYVYGDLSPDEMRSVRLHAAQCETCRKDLQSRGAAVSLIGRDVPELTDTEKQRIAWFVEGAVHATGARTPLRLRLAVAFGGVLLAAAGIAVGVLLASNLAGGRVQQVEKPGSRPAVRAVVEVQEELPTAPDKHKSDTTVGKVADSGEESRPRRVAEAVTKAVNSALRVGAGVASRRGTESQRSRIPSDEVTQEDSVPTESSKDESSIGPTKLPEPSNLKDARVEPSASDQ